MDLTASRRPQSRLAGDSVRPMFNPVELIKIYQCFCDRTRLRILNLLNQGPLCVCHFQEVLGEPQVKISKHLGYLKTHGLVTARRDANWMVYGLPETPSPELKANLACLHDCVREDPVFRRDLARFKKFAAQLPDNSPICCERPRSRPRKASGVVTKS